MVTKFVGPIHFEDFSGEQFERLVFAYYLRTAGWKSLEWNGQRGVDGGRDIIGIAERDGNPDQTVCLFCANWQKPTLGKIKTDLFKTLGSDHPDKYIVVFGGAVSAQLRDSAKTLANSCNIKEFTILSGGEFEEHLRKDTESLLKRFFNGVEFPESPKLLEQFVDATEAETDDEILQLMSYCFDRPAFTTPFHYESYLPAFDRAIMDTISAINTGICKDRAGNVIRKIPPKHAIKNDHTRQVLSQIVCQLEQLRASFDYAILAGKIKDYGGQYDKTSTIEFRDRQICKILDQKRQDILSAFHSIYTNFPVRMWNSLDMF